LSLKDYSDRANLFVTSAEGFFHSSANGRRRSLGVSDFLLADTTAVTTSQLLKDDRAKNQERLVDAVNHFPAVGVNASGNKNAVARPADATPKLMDICCMVLAMELALLVCSSLISA
jgi:hypothetical protein